MSSDAKCSAMEQDSPSYPLPLYQYTPLSTPKSFRVLRVKRRLHTPTQALAVEIRHVEWDREKYDCLSYTWGDSTAKSFIVCDGTMIPVTSNCYHILAQLRMIHRHRHRPLFVDAVCIDQESLVERNHQVAAMGEIYSGADRVVCWLGDHEIGKLAKAAYYMLRTVPFPKLFTFVPNLPYFHKLARRLSSLDEALIDTTWYTRVWTIQEFALAKNPYFQWGAISMRSPEIMRIWEKIREDYSIDDFIDSRAYKVHDTARKLVQAPINTRRTSRAAMNILVENRYKGATEPKDRIFSMFKILKEHGAQLKQPDYSRDLVDISQEVTLALLRSDCGLGFLKRACSPAPWPSWVPDLTKWDYDVRTRLSSSSVEEGWSVPLENSMIRVGRAATSDRLTAVHDNITFPLGYVYFETENGYSGQATAAVKIGDYVVRILGTGTFFAVRRMPDESHRLISPVTESRKTLGIDSHTHFGINHTRDMMTMLVLS